MNIQQLPSKRQYVATWRRVSAIAKVTPQAPVVCMSWFDEPAICALHRFRHALHARINERGGIREVSGRHPDSQRVIRELKRRYVSECRWCGRVMGYEHQESRRFCSTECRRSYY